MATSEGAFACDDAIRYLMQVQPLYDDIYLNFGMCLAAKGNCFWNVSQECLFFTKSTMVLEAVEECCPTGSFDYPDSVAKMINYGFVLAQHELNR